MRKEKLMDYALTIGGFLLAFYTCFNLSREWAFLGLGFSIADLVRVFLRK